MIQYPNYLTNVYGLARSILALGTLSTFVFNDIYELIPIEYYLQNTMKAYNIFYILSYENIEFVRSIVCIILLCVISGYLPQITGILHFWVMFSFFNSVLAVEGGDQITLILVALLVPVTLMDRRLNHWYKNQKVSYSYPEILNYFAYSCTCIIKVQMSILYLHAAVGKMNIKEWIDGTATYYWFNHNLFGAPNWLNSSIGFLFENSNSVFLITWGIMILELLLAAAIFMNKNAQKILLLLGICFHFIIFVVHGLPAFGLSMTGGLILYLVPINLHLNFKSIFNLKKQWQQVSFI